jgi:hypothetical protein
MRFYLIHFRTYEEEYNHSVIPKRKYIVEKSRNSATDKKHYLNNEGGLLVMENEIQKYWKLGGGPDVIKFVGEMDDALFKPTLSEPDFVDDQIKSKKNGENVGYQG